MNSSFLFYKKIFNNKFNNKYFILIFILIILFSLFSLFSLFYKPNYKETFLTSSTKNKYKENFSFYFFQKS